MRTIIALFLGLLAVQSCCCVIFRCFNDYPAKSTTCPSWMDYQYKRAIIPFCFPNGYPYTFPPECGCFDARQGFTPNYGVPCIPPILPHPSGSGLVVVPPCDWRQRYFVMKSQRKGDTCVSRGIFLELLAEIVAAFTSETTYQNSVKFVYLNERNESTSQLSTQCKIGENNKLAIIIHGWMESCETVWVPILMQNLNRYRHGCIVCMDYSAFSMNSDYYSLVRDFNGIASVLTKKLKEFQGLSFHPNNIYMFGFSFGAQLALEAGRRFGKMLIKQIDVCDPAGPGFDNNVLYSRNSPRLSAQNVQCVHTSSDKGTRKRDCHQNWNMGNCGNSQIAAGPIPLGSHGLCPYFYNFAFEHRFLAIPKPQNCRSNRDAAGIVIGNLSMGYMDALKYEGRFVEGQDFFANTFKAPPYNVDSIGSN